MDSIRYLDKGLKFPPDGFDYRYEKSRPKDKNWYLEETQQ